MKRYTGINFRASVEEIAHKLAKAYSKQVRIFWSSAVSTAGVSGGGHLYLANIADDATLTHQDLLKYAGFVAHEILHMVYTDFGQSSCDQYVSNLHNGVEDAFIERNGIRDNFTGNIANLLTSLVDQMVDQALANVSDWSDPNQYPFVLAIYLRDHATKKIPLAKGLAPIFDEAKRRLVFAQNSADTLAIAKWVYAQLQQPQKTTPQNAPKRSQGGDQGEGEGDPAPDGENASEDGQNDDRSLGVGKGVGDAKQVTAKHQGVNPEPTLDTQTDSAPLYNTKNYGKDAYGMSAPWCDPSINVPAKLRYELKKILDKSGIDEFQHGRKTGSINVNALPTHAFNDRLFKQRRSEDGIDTAVTILVDASGSMFTDGEEKDGISLRMHTAVQTTIAMLDVFTKAGVACAVLAFGSCPAFIKRFDERKQKGIERLIKINDMGGTDDYIAVRYCHELLNKRTEKRKLCFVITDGYGDMADTKRQCIAGENLGITTIGVGIDVDNMDYTYPQNVNVVNVGDLGRVSFNKIKMSV